jgi:hypothetical protein
LDSRVAISNVIENTYENTVNIFYYVPFVLTQYLHPQKMILATWAVPSSDPLPGSPPAPEPDPLSVCLVLPSQINPLLPGNVLKKLFSEKEKLPQKVS